MKSPLALLESAIQDLGVTCIGFFAHSALHIIDSSPYNVIKLYSSCHSHRKPTPYTWVVQACRLSVITGRSVQSQNVCMQKNTDVITGFQDVNANRVVSACQLFLWLVSWVPKGTCSKLSPLVPSNSPYRPIFIQLHLVARRWLLCLAFRHGHILLGTVCLQWFG